MNEKLVKYVEENVFPIYEKNDKGHDLSHIKHVVERSLELSKNLNLNPNMLYCTAAYHDIGHHIDADNHEIASAQMFSEDRKIRRFFTLEELVIIKEAIEDHRASLEYEPRNIYGKLLSSADRNIDADLVLKRTYWYGLKHYPDYTIEQQLDRAFNHIMDKFGTNGYAKMYIVDDKYREYLRKINELLSSRENFAKIFKQINNIK